MDDDKAIRAAKLTLGAMMEKRRAETAKSRAQGQIAPSKYLPDVPRQVHANGGYVPQASLPIPKLAVAKPLRYGSQPSGLEALANMAGAASSLGDSAATIMGKEGEQPPAPPQDSHAGRAEAGGGMNPQAVAAYNALLEAYGQPLTVVSDYRTPSENQRVGGAKGSQHMHGNAYDIDTSHLSHDERLALADQAWDAGFRGIGFYDNNMHFDVGDPRAWGPSYSRDSIPDWALPWAQQRYGYADGGPTGMGDNGGPPLSEPPVDLGQVRDQRQLQTFHKGMMSDMSNSMSQAMEAHQKAVDAGVFDGYEVGDVLQGKSAPLKITGRYVQKWKPSTTTLAHFDRMGAKPTIIEHEGQQYIPMLRYTSGSEAGEDNQEGTVYLDGVRAAGYRKMGGLRAVKADGGSVDDLPPVGKNRNGVPEEEAVASPLRKAEYPYMSMVPARHVYAEPLRQAINKAHAEAKEVDLPIDQIVTDVSAIGRSRVKNPAGGLPFVERINGVHHLRDGNHRVAAAMLRGDKTVRALVADMDEAIKANGRADGGYVPQKTQKAYKLFRRKDGKLLPLFVNADKPVEMGKWLEAEAGPQGKAQGKVKSKLGDLAYRPGWHAGDLPIATHIGGKSKGDLKAPDYRPDDQVWAEVEMADDHDWQSVANSRGKGVKAAITDQVPLKGFYRFKTNPNMTGNWLIGGHMKVNRVLSDDEVKQINDAAGTADLPRLQRADGGEVDDDKPVDFGLARAMRNFNQNSSGPTPEAEGVFNRIADRYEASKRAYDAALSDGVFDNVKLGDVYKYKPLEGSTPMKVVGHTMSHIGSWGGTTQPKYVYHDHFPVAEMKSVDGSGSIKRYPVEMLEDRDRYDFISGKPRIARADGGRLSLYSKAAQIVRGLKDQKMDVKDILKYAEGKGAKKAELAAVDVPSGKATPKQVADHIEFMQPQIGVRRLGESQGLTPQENAEFSEMTAPNAPFPTGAAMDRYRELSAKLNPDVPSQYARYQLGGKRDNYREHILTLDSHDGPTYTSPVHWSGTPNPLVHVRMSDRMDGNKKILHIEELQSDWNNDARKTGIRTGNEQAEYDAYVAKMRQDAIDKVKARTGRDYYDPNTGETYPTMSPMVAQAQIEKYQSMDPYMLALKMGRQAEHRQKFNATQTGVPKAPYINPDRDDASEVALKHILMEAAKGGYDGIAFTPDEAQEARWPGHTFKGIYNKKLPGMADKLVRQHDPDQGSSSAMRIDGYVAPMIELSPEARDSIMQNGFSSFRRGGAVGYSNGGNVGGMMLRMRRAGINTKDDFWNRWRDYMRAKAGPDPRLSSIMSKDSHFQRIDGMLRVHRQDADQNGLASVLNAYGRPNDQGHVAARFPREIFQGMGIEPTIDNIHAAYHALPDDESGRQGFSNGGTPDDKDAGSHPATPAAQGTIPDAGRVRGGTGLFQTQDETPLEGLPASVRIPLTGQVIKAGPDPRIRAMARSYMEKAGLPYNPPTKYAKVDPARAKRIAAAYDEMADNPDHPLTRASYEAMIKETLAQYEAAKAAGFKAEFWNPRTQKDPYDASPRLAVEDVRDNHHMWVYPTYAGYGSGEPISEEDARRNPMLQLTGETWNGIPVTVNDIFRAVHDYFGHAKEGVGFRHDGEENAWRSHASMYSPLARMAMTTETRGQNNWLNFGPHGEANRTARTEDTEFAPQKVGILPHWVHHEGAEDFMGPDEVEEMRRVRAAHSSDVSRALALTRRFTKDGAGAMMRLKP